MIQATSATKNAYAGTAKKAQRRPSTWANWRTLVPEPGRTAHRAAPPVDEPLHRPPLPSGMVARRRASASSFPARIARNSSRACFFCCSRFKTASFVCLVRMTGERGSTERVKPQRAGGRSPFRGQDASCRRLKVNLPQSKIPRQPGLAVHAWISRVVNVFARWPIFPAHCSRLDPNRNLQRSAQRPFER